MRSHQLFEYNHLSLSQLSSGRYFLKYKEGKRFGILAPRSPLFPYLIGQGFPSNQKIYLYLSHLSNNQHFLSQIEF